MRPAIEPPFPYVRVYKITYLEWHEDSLYSSGEVNKKVKRVKGTTQRDAANKLKAALVGQAIEIASIQDEGVLDVE